MDAEVCGEDEIVDSVLFMEKVPVDIVFTVIITGGGVVVVVSSVVLLE